MTTLAFLIRKKATSTHMADWKLLINFLHETKNELMIYGLDD